MLIKNLALFTVNGCCCPKKEVKYYENVANKNYDSTGLARTKDQREADIKLDALDAGFRAHKI